MTLCSIKTTYSTSKLMVCHQFCHTPFHFFSNPFALNHHQQTTLVVESSNSMRLSLLSPKVSIRSHFHPWTRIPLVFSKFFRAGFTRLFQRSLLFVTTKIVVAELAVVASHWWRYIRGNGNGTFSGIGGGGGGDVAVLQNL